MALKKIETIEGKEYMLDLNTKFPILFLRGIKNTEEKFWILSKTWREKRHISNENIIAYQDGVDLLKNCAEWKALWKDIPCEFRPYSAGEETGDMYISRFGYQDNQDFLSWTATPGETYIFGIGWIEGNPGFFYSLGVTSTKYVHPLSQDCGIRELCRIGFDHVCEVEHRGLVDSLPGEDLRLKENPTPKKSWLRRLFGGKSE